MSKAKMYLPVRPDGTLMDEMFPLRSEEDALCAAARWMPDANSGETMRMSGELAAMCWRAIGGHWGFPDSLALEMARAVGYTAVEVFLGPQKLPKVHEALEHMRLVSRNSFGLDLSRAGIAELDAAERGE